MKPSKNNKILSSQGKKSLGQIRTKNKYMNFSRTTEDKIYPGQKRTKFVQDRKGQDMHRTKKNYNPWNHTKNLRLNLSFKGLFIETSTWL